ncbi:MAG: tetratricopeptide repeat protein [Acidobacteriota bacterium]|nr:tetratricopeptide repeat protein [Acidobacteriota bacterium]
MLLLAISAWSAMAQPVAPLETAYRALRANQYDEAVRAFHQAIADAPERASIRKDLAYTLLKIGENESARGQFADAMRLDPSDSQAALEYAFLCHETKLRAEARRVFDRWRKSSNAIAEQAFQNIDQPLAEGIARWKQALELSPDNFSAHQELARLAEERDELILSAEHYEKAWRLRPTERSLLLDLGRVWKRLGRGEDAGFVLIAASRGAQPRVAEAARELLPARYPYVYEFERALDLDSNNTDLRRELAYLLLEMGQKEPAERQFAIIHQQAPEDLMSAAQLGFLRLGRRDVVGAQPLIDQVLRGGDAELADRVRVALKVPALQKRPDSSESAGVNEAKALADKSLQAGYLKDAVKYLALAHEFDPVDFSVMLKLAWTYNILHQDDQAIGWFNLARKSPDLAVAAEAERAWRSLHPNFSRFRTTAWVFPFYSTRWKDAFGYAQVKTEYKLGVLPVRVYVSIRFIGDLRGAAGPAAGNSQPQYLSEDSVIFGVGASTSAWHGVRGWMEAGEAVKYVTSRKDVSTAIPDYRGGLAYAKGFGHLLGSEGGFFAENNSDAVFISRFQKDFIVYSQTRTGYTLAPRAQVYLNWNASVDRLRQYWANAVETGPGVRFRVVGLPLLFSVDLLRGVYTVNEGNPRKPNYFDLRAGFWYAITK